MYFNLTKLERKCDKICTSTYFYFLLKMDRSFQYKPFEKPLILSIPITAK